VDYTGAVYHENNTVTNQKVMRFFQKNSEAATYFLGSI
jgi:hypothetical protein